MADTAERFANDTANHTMTVLHDDGLYRHLHFREAQHSFYWFDLITVPGSLIFRGDGDSFVFARDRDMFAFFRGSAYKGRPNYSYWAEKVTSERDRLMRYDQDRLQQLVDEAVADAVKDNPRLTRLAEDVRDHITEELIGDESIDLKLVSDFQHWTDPMDQYRTPRKEPDFEFGDTWEWNCRDYDWWFLWACHAIVWGIRQYDTAKACAEKPVEVAA